MDGRKFCTAEELASFVVLSKEASSITSGLFGPFTPPWIAEAQEKLRKAIHAAALRAGLPEIAGYYGIDLETGEFIGPEQYNER